MLAGRPERLIREVLATPAAPIQVITDESGVLRVLDFDADSPRVVRLLARYYGGVPVAPGRTPEAARRALIDYFAGDLAALGRVPRALPGTDFQRTVWAALTAIPAGETTTYAALAARIGRPLAVRAVGAANGANPVGIVVPCHRVIGTDGSLTGYGGGIARKRWLLAHEAAAAPQGLPGSNTPGTPSVS
jgi:methylated-DNA-[protein]-cysteine S-methyltransferase